jgi:hypothetical protein
LFKFVDIRVEGFNLNLLPKEDVDYIKTMIICNKDIEEFIITEEQRRKSIYAKNPFYEADLTINLD